MNGTLPPGTMLPSIRGLARELKISVITVKKAYEDLEIEGYISTSQGKGSFVAQTGAERIKESILKDAQQLFQKGIEQCNRLNMNKGNIMKTFETILNSKNRGE